MLQAERPGSPNRRKGGLPCRRLTLHRLFEGSRDTFGGVVQGIVGEMGVSDCGLCLGMTQDLSHHR